MRQVSVQQVGVQQVGVQQVGVQQVGVQQIGVQQISVQQSSTTSWRTAIRLTSPKSKAVLNHVMNITPVKFRRAPEIAS